MLWASRKGKRPSSPVSSLRLNPAGVIRTAWQGKLEAPKAPIMDSALAAVKAAEIVRENGSSAWKNAVPGRRLLLFGFFFAALIRGHNKRASGLLFKAGSRRLSKNLRRIRKGRTLSNLQTYQAACSMGKDDFLRRKGSFPEPKLEKAACGGGLHIRSPAYYKTFFLTSRCFWPSVQGWKPQTRERRIGPRQYDALTQNSTCSCGTTLVMPP